jgi:hypothetical protein
MFKECASVLLDDGREVTCSVDHPWLVKTWRESTVATTGRPASLAWIETFKLRPGDLISSPLRVWGMESSFEMGWLSGIWDGEGSAGRYGTGSWRTTSLSVAQNPGPVLSRIKAGLDSMGIGYREYKNACASDVTKFQISSISGVMELLGRLRPTRLGSAGLWEGASIRTKQPGQYVAVVEVVPVGKQEVVTLGTSTRTFLAEGLASHNSDDFFSDRARRAGWPSLMCNGYAFRHHWAQHRRGAGMTENERMTHDQQLYYQAIQMVTYGQWDKPWPDVPDAGKGR